MFNFPALGFAAGLGDGFSSYAAAFNIATADATVNLSRHCRCRRTTFSRLQLDTLEAVFNRTHYPGFGERQQLGIDFALDEKRIQVWFKNRRARFRQQEKMSPMQAMKCEEAFLAQGNTPSFPSNFPLYTEATAALAAAGLPAPALNLFGGTTLLPSQLFGLLQQQAKRAALQPKQEKADEEPSASSLFTNDLHRL